MQNQKGKKSAENANLNLKRFKFRQIANACAEIAV